MKYTKYLLKTQFINIKQFETKKIYYMFLIVLGIPLAVAGIILILGLVPFTYIFDKGRIIKFWKIKRERRRR